MFEYYLKKLWEAQTQGQTFRELAELDRRSLEDIGVCPQEISLVSSDKGAWRSAVIASGMSARWSLSGDWELDLIQ